jgi:uncharacterized membrane protein YkoI
VQKPRYSLAEAVAKGVAKAGAGVPFKAELELDKGRLMYSIDVAQGKKTCCVVLDVADGREIEHDLDDEDRAALAAACKISLATAIATGLRQTAGKALAAEMQLFAGKPVIEVTIFDGKTSVVRVDGITGAAVTNAANATTAAVQDINKAQDADRQFTDVFVLDPEELAPTGVNPFFVLTPGHTRVLESRDGDEVVQLTITVLQETRKVAGVEVSVVEERETKGGRPVEVSRNFCAISKKTNSVYYFGEEVDIYEDGKVVRHDGAWLAGEKGARFGLMIPGTVLLGSRYYQEIAPGVAMDRAEVVSLAGTLDTPAGHFADLLVTEESTPLEKGKERKYYARGIGMIGDAELRLVKVQK